jgi:hypothetical protein
MEHQDVVQVGRSSISLITFVAIGFACSQAPSPAAPARRPMGASALRSGDVTQLSCECQGTGPGNLPVTAACGEIACGSDYMLYACADSGWSWTGQSCGSGAGGSGGGSGNPCQCDGTGPGNVPVSVGCGETACGSDYYSYACGASGWSWTGQSCGGGGGNGDTAGSCECHGTGPGDAPVTAICGVSACGSDHFIYACNADGWASTGQGCSGTQAPGESCGGPGECAAGSCTDGRCCTEICSTCQACTGPAGTCENLPLYAKDNDPANACVGTSACDGAGNCRLDNGQVCTVDASVCASAICKQGVCCDFACGETCKSCVVPGKVGTCSTVDISSDVSNCGACGHACPSGHVACSNGICACERGWADCNLDLQTDGCETNIDTDPANCGGCNMACSTNHTIPACTAGNCTSRCNPPTGQMHADCNGNMRDDGCETPIFTNPNNCGKCGNVCTGTTKEMSGLCGNTTGGVQCLRCTSGKAPTGLRNCDLDPSNGCETSIKTNTNCGDCGVICPRGTRCSGGNPDYWSCRPLP